MIDYYKTVLETAEAEVIEKKSRFIGTIFSIESEEHANEILASIRKKYWDATHNCYAYVLGYNNEIQRYNDDGEPGGTAGMPILEVIRGSQIRNILIVVTRYFGGTLLGTGGLVRAYTDASKAVLEVAKVIEYIWCSIYSVTTDYSLSGKLQYLFSEENIRVLDTKYTEQVEFNIAIEKDKEGNIKSKMIDMTNANIELEHIEEKFLQK